MILVPVIVLGMVLVIQPKSVATSEGQAQDLARKAMEYAVFVSITVHC